MARSVFLILIALLGLFSILGHAKKEKLRLYAFTSDDCNGPPLGGNIDIKLGKCHNLLGGAQSIKPFAKKHSKWIEGINDGDHCAVTTYSQYGCLPSQETSDEDIPQVISQCVSSSGADQILSVKFDCGGRHMEEPETTNYTTILTHTVYHSAWHSSANAFSPSASTRTYVETKVIAGTRPDPDVLSTVTVTAVPPAMAPTVPVVVEITTITLSSPLKHQMLHADSEPESNSELDDTDSDNDEVYDLKLRNKRKWKGPRKGVWMMHPWSMGLICYECYTKSSKNIEDFECRSGPKNPTDCGPQPDLTEQVTVTQYPVTTVTAGQQMVHLEKRKSWHRRVSFPHPWFLDRIVCADGEWEKRGKPKSEIRIQHPKANMKKCDKDPEHQNIEPKLATVTFQGPTHTITVDPPVTMSTVTLPTPVFSTVTVEPSPPMSYTTLTVPLITTVFDQPPVAESTVVITTVLGQPPVSESPVVITTVFLSQPPAAAPISIVTSTLRHRDL
ncbi:hypothetical protein BDW02DRAFT_632796 [Decorospora gaudefroyi]|uniref:Cyanovirin-N domain-containing protein n=1 Tax=Decorospora gaudefroyi TaxID=184978 RepID=A0A6A5K326_9PLEO|nr:hypothetical protein BDW02DRAFT_632796 [Decorospora gaudefroyi]